MSGKRKQIIAAFLNTITLPSVILVLIAILSEITQLYQKCCPSTENAALQCQKCCPQTIKIFGALTVKLAKIC